MIITIMVITVTVTTTIIIDVHCVAIPLVQARGRQPRHQPPPLLGTHVCDGAHRRFEGRRVDVRRHGDENLHVVGVRPVAEVGAGLQ